MSACTDRVCVVRFSPREQVVYLILVILAAIGIAMAALAAIYSSSAVVSRT